MRFFKYFLTSVAAVFICLPCASYPRDGGPQPADRTIKVDVPEAAIAIPFLTSMSLDAPPGFKVSLFASNLGGVRMMAESSDGVIYAAVPSEGAVIALPDRDHDGVADSKVIFASGLNKPHSMVFIGAPSTTLDTKALEVTEAVSSKVVLGAQILVAETGALVLLKDTDNDMKADVIKIISTDLPEGGGHWTRTVAAGPDGYLYVSAGSSCNACEEKDQRRAAVLRFKPEGGKAEVFAKGLRNSVGIAFEPNTKELWGVDNGADWLGENLPPEELNRIVKGGDYGWPYCYGDNIPDPDVGTPERCSSSLPPAVKMQAHSAPLGMAFGYNLKFPQPYRDVLFVAFHGSWNRLVPTGYKLIGIPFKNGRPAGEPFDFITGWMRGGVAWGRPVGLLVGGDGALYLSDDYAGAVYRITYGHP